MAEQQRIQGTVRWFSRVKGYGFIQPDGQEKDVFVHFSAIRGEGYRNLNEGQRVEFLVEDTPKGPQAAEVEGLTTTPKGPQAAEVEGLTTQPA
jgi:CspA family cold shock protein